MKNTLKLQGKEYPVEVTLDAIKKFCNVKGITNLVDFDKVNLTSFDDAELLIWYCLEAGSKVHGSKLDIKQDELGDYLRVADVVAFMEIYRRQSEIEPPVKKKNLIARIWNWLLRTLRIRRNAR